MTGTREDLQEFCPTAAREVLSEYHRRHGQDDTAKLFDDLDTAFRRLVRHNEHRQAIDSAIPGSLAFMQEAFRPNLAREKSKQELEQFSAEIGNIIIPPDVNGFARLRTPPNARIEAIAAKATLSHQVCRAALFNDGVWRATEANVYRLESAAADLLFTDHSSSGESAHIVNLSAKAEIPTIRAIAEFRRIVGILHTAFPVLTAKSASKGDRFVTMPDNRKDFRFEKINSPWGSVSKLCAFWLSVGAITQKAVDSTADVNRLLILSRAKIEGVLEGLPNVPLKAHPFCMMKRGRNFYEADTERRILDSAKRFLC